MAVPAADYYRFVIQLNIVTVVLLGLVSAKIVLMEVYTYRLQKTNQYDYTSAEPGMYTHTHRLFCFLALNPVTAGVITVHSRNILYFVVVIVALWMVWTYFSEQGVGDLAQRAVQDIGETTGNILFLFIGGSHFFQWRTCAFRSVLQSVHWPLRGDDHRHRGPHANGSPPSQFRE